ncbi:MAG TPA: aminotransferase class I/II-fold pyridoxal phosphate-dependent enzyme, partial [Tahibacter sp.]|nr:aminotransferase class I/II-fold pyridoxal phosphate-dependent enzyme [Tahibacter sp.]
MTDKPWQGRFPRNDIISLLDVNRRHNLAESTSRNLSFGELIDLVGGEEALRGIELGYGSSAGLPALRKAIARDHDVDADDVVVTQGTAQGLFLLAFELCRHTEHAVLLTPCFPPTRDALSACGVGIGVDEIALRFDHGYRIDIARTAAKLRPETRIVSIASPQNPSGVAASHDELAALLAAMAERSPDALL